MNNQLLILTAAKILSEKTRSVQEIESILYFLLNKISENKIKVADLSLLPGGMIELLFTGGSVN